MRHALLAALCYFCFVFAAGFAMGTLRTLLITPVIGELGAVVLELPVMLAISWWACGFTLRRLLVPKSWPHRAAMGMIAFILLLSGEAAISLFLGGLTLSQHMALYTTAPVLIGLAAQVAFAAFPLVRM